MKFYSTEAAPAICWSRLGWRGGTSQSTFEMGTRHAKGTRTLVWHVYAGNAHGVGESLSQGLLPPCAYPSILRPTWVPRASFVPACGSGRQRFVEKARPGEAPFLQNVVLHYRVYANFPGRVHLLRGAVAPSPVSALD